MLSDYWRISTCLWKTIVWLLRIWECYQITPVPEYNKNALIPPWIICHIKYISLSLALWMDDIYTVEPLGGKPTRIRRCQKWRKYKVNIQSNPTWNFPRIKAFQTRGEVLWKMSAKFINCFLTILVLQTNRLQRLQVFCNISSRCHTTQQYKHMILCKIVKQCADMHAKTFWEWKSQSWGNKVRR